MFSVSVSSATCKFLAAHYAISQRAEYVGLLGAIRGRKVDGLNPGAHPFSLCCYRFAFAGFNVESKTGARCQSDPNSVATATTHDSLSTVS